MSSKSTPTLTVEERLALLQTALMDIDVAVRDKQTRRIKKLKQEIITHKTQITNKDGSYEELFVGRGLAEQNYQKTSNSQSPSVSKVAHVMEPDGDGNYPSVGIVKSSTEPIEMKVNDTNSNTRKQVKPQVSASIQALADKFPQPITMMNYIVDDSPNKPLVNPFNASDTGGFDSKKAFNRNDVRIPSSSVPIASTSLPSVSTSRSGSPDTSSIEETPPSYVRIPTPIELSMPASLVKLEPTVLKPRLTEQDRINLKKQEEELVAKERQRLLEAALAAAKLQEDNLRSTAAASLDRKSPSPPPVLIRNNKNQQLPSLAKPPQPVDPVDPVLPVATPVLTPMTTPKKLNGSELPPSSKSSAKRRTHPTPSSSSKKDEEDRMKKAKKALDLVRDSTAALDAQLTRDVDYQQPPPQRDDKMDGGALSHDDCKKTIQDLEKQIELLTKMKEQQKQELTNMDSNLRQSQDSVLTASSTVSQLHLKIKGLESQLASLGNGQIDQWSTLYQKVNAQYIEASNKLTATQEELKLKTQAYTLKVSEVFNLETLVKNQNVEGSRLQVALTAMEATLAATRLSDANQLAEHDQLHEAVVQQLKTRILALEQEARTSLPTIVIQADEGANEALRTQRLIAAQQELELKEVQAKYTELKSELEVTQKTQATIQQVTKLLESEREQAKQHAATQAVQIHTLTATITGLTEQKELTNERFRQLMAVHVAQETALNELKAEELEMLHRANARLQLVVDQLYATQKLHLTTTELNQAGDKTKAIEDRLIILTRPNVNSGVDGNSVEIAKLEMQLVLAKELEKQLRGNIDALEIQVRMYQAKQVEEDDLKQVEARKKLVEQKLEQLTQTQVRLLDGLNLPPVANVQSNKSVESVLLLEEIAALKAQLQKQELIPDVQKTPAELQHTLNRLRLENQMEGAKVMELRQRVLELEVEETLHNEKVQTLKRSMTQLQLIDGTEKHNMEAQLKDLNDQITELKNARDDTINKLLDSKLTTAAAYRQSGSTIEQVLYVLAQYKVQMTDLTSRCKKEELASRTQLGLVTTQLVQSKQETEACRKEIAGIHTQVDTSLRQAVEAKAELTICFEKLDYTKKQVQLLENQLGRKDGGDPFITSLLELEHADLREELDETKSLYEASQKEVAQLKLDIVTQVELVKALEADVDSTTAALNNHVTAAADNSGRINTPPVHKDTTTLAEMAKQVAELESQQSKLKSEADLNLSRMQAEVDSERDKVRVLNEKASKWDLQVKDLEDDLKRDARAVLDSKVAEMKLDRAKEVAATLMNAEAKYNEMVKEGEIKAKEAMVAQEKLEGLMVSQMAAVKQASEAAIALQKTKKDNALLLDELNQQRLTGQSAATELTVKCDQEKTALLKELTNVRLASELKYNTLMIAKQKLEEDLKRALSRPPTPNPTFTFLPTIPAANPELQAKITAQERQLEELDELNQQLHIKLEAAKNHVDAPMGSANSNLEEALFMLKEELHQKDLELKRLHALHTRTKTQHTHASTRIPIALQMKLMTNLI